jgi:hypothetical protein
LPASLDLNYFEVLPLHPEPTNFESLTSYLTRIAQANAISHPLAFSKIFGVTVGELIRLPDYPLLSIGTIAVLTMCVKERLMASTLFHLGRKFGHVRSASVSTLSTFLRSSLCSSLRYCPLCLADGLYYSLKWRFLPLTGCSLHGCRLLDRCGHCGGPMPLFALPAKSGVCPSCGGDLRSCFAPLLAERERQRLHDRNADGEYLLSPQPCEQDDDTIKRVGGIFAALRRERRMSVWQVADGTSIPLYEVMKIERGDVGQHTSFDGYVYYADFLGVTLRDLFRLSSVQGVDVTTSALGTLDTGLPEQQSLLQKQEHIVFEHLQEVTRSIIALGERVSLQSISGHLRMPLKIVRSYASIEAVRDLLQAERMAESTRRSQRLRQRREDGLVEKVEHIVAMLHANGQTLTQSAISALVGLPLPGLLSHPRLRAMVEVYPTRQQLTQQREEDTLEQIRVAIIQLKASGKPVSRVAVSRLSGLPLHTLAKYSRVRLLFDQLRHESRLLGDSGKRAEVNR